MGADSGCLTPARRVVEMKPETIITVLVPIETAARLEKVKKGIARLLTPMFDVSVMPNQSSPDKTALSVRVDRFLKRRLELAAKSHKMQLSQYVVWVLGESARNVELNEDDVRKILKAIEEARRGNRVDHRLSANRAKAKVGENG